MNSCIEHLQQSGISDANELAAFVTQFLEDPSLFFEMDDAGRQEMEQRMDEALDLFKLGQLENNLKNEVDGATNQNDIKNIKNNPEIRTAGAAGDGAQDG